MPYSIRMLFLLVCQVVSSPAYSDSFSIMSDQSMMKDHVIVDVGNASKVEPPFNTNWVTNVYELNGRCFTMPGYYGMWGYGSKAALLLVNAQKAVKMAFLETGIGSLDVDVQSVTLIHCPEGSGVVPYSDDPQDRLKQIEEKRKELERKLKKLEGSE